jgi:hypothetical protein
MANINIDAGQTYRFARVQNSTIILGSDNHSHAVRTIGNQLVVSGANVPSNAVDVFVNTSGYVRIKRPAVGTNSAIFTIQNESIDGYCFMRFDGRNDYAMGTFNDDALTGDQGDFQLRDSTNLSTSPRTEGSVCFSFSRDKEFFLPNIDAATGTNYVKYDTSTREITYQTSTQKVKKNIISPSSSIYNSILSLQPRYFQTKNPKDNDIQFLGFIAEEVASVSPSLATYGADYNFDESGSRVDLASNNSVPIDINERAIIASLVGKIQDLEQRIQQLES